MNSCVRNRLEKVYNKIQIMRFITNIAKRKISRAIDFTRF